VEDTWAVEGRGTRGWKKLHSEEVYHLYPSPNIIGVIKWGGGACITYGEEESCIQSFGGET
jgi:hypothetical protein